MCIWMFSTRLLLTIDQSLYTKYIGWLVAYVCISDEAVNLLRSRLFIIIRKKKIILSEQRTENTLTLLRPNHVYHYFYGLNILDDVYCIIYFDKIPARIKNYSKNEVVCLFDEIKVCGLYIDRPKPQIWCF